jgi:hypothetical protein
MRLDPVLGRACASASRITLAIVAACLFMSSAGDGLDDYTLSYSAKTETSSRRSYSRGRRSGAEKRNDALRVGELGKGGDGEGYVWTWRRQDKAAHTPPLRSVSTPREQKELGRVGVHLETYRWDATRTAPVHPVRGASC